jgi:cell division topological specificity factor
MDFFNRVMGHKPKSAKSAKDRLQLVLINDRTDITPAVLDALQAELIEVISRHVDIDPSTVRIDIEHEGRSQRLIADIPLRSVPRRRAG